MGVKSILRHVLGLSRQETSTAHQKQEAQDTTLSGVVEVQVKEHHALKWGSARDVALLDVVSSSPRC